jgi:NADH-quinone oxidoreductase subunit H
VKEWVDALVAGHPYGQAILHGILILVFVLVTVLVLLYMERKVAGFLQTRLGPMRTGPYGILQTVADALKLLLKEDVVPAASDRFLFLLAPYFALVPAVLVFVVLPFSEGWLAADFNLAVLYIIGASTIAIMGVLMAGWGTNNKYSLLGGVRSAAQLISYEIPVVLAILCVVFYAGTMSTVSIVEAQSGVWRLLGVIPLPKWLIFSPPLMLAALLYLAGQLAETNRVPFDLSEAESELVSGYNVEYSGMRFAMFFLAEFAATFFAAALGVILFFGGWDGLTGFWGALWFIAKSYLGVFLLMWIRWTLPRVRIDQLLGFAWKLLVPAGLVAVLWTMAVVVYKAGG